MDKPSHSFVINPRRIALTLLGTSFIMMLLSLSGQWIRFYGGFHVDPVQDVLLKYYWNEVFVNNEANFPTFWNTFILIVMAVLTLVIAALKFAQRDKYRFEWWFLGSVFLFLSIDEASAIHEKFNILLKGLPNLNGWVYYKWLYAGAIVVAVLTLVFLRFYLHLDLRNKILFPVSMTLYLLGAFGGELFSGHYAEFHGTKNITYMLMTHGEEFGEHIGINLMIFTLLSYIVLHYSRIAFTVIPAGTSRSGKV